MAERLRLPFEILSDAKFAFANALALPAFKTGGMPREWFSRIAAIVASGTPWRRAPPV